MADRAPDSEGTGGDLWPDRQAGWNSEPFTADRSNTVRASWQQPPAMASRDQFAGENHQSGKRPAAIKTGERGRNYD